MIKRSKKTNEPLTGEALLTKVKQLGDLSKEAKARACGYYTTTSKGGVRVNVIKFQNALIDAADLLPSMKHSSGGRSGRSASYRITVQSNGNLLIGAAYTKQMGLNPGDEFIITLGRKHIQLKHIDSEE